MTSDVERKKNEMHVMQGERSSSRGFVRKQAPLSNWTFPSNSVIVFPLGGANFQTDKQNYLGTSLAWSGENLLLLIQKVCQRNCQVCSPANHKAQISKHTLTFTPIDYEIFFFDTIYCYLLWEWGEKRWSVSIFMSSLLTATRGHTCMGARHCGYMN